MPSNARPMTCPEALRTGLPELPPVISLSVKKLTGSVPAGAPERPEAATSDSARDFLDAEGIGTAQRPGSLTL